jgi:leucyl/phenylalanyl-tRNA--protein transferase
MVGGAPIRAPPTMRQQLRRTPLTPELLLGAYAQGLFPMAERRGGTQLYWMSPEKRGIIPLADFHVPRRLARTVRAGVFTVTSDHAFPM